MIDYFPCIGRQDEVEQLIIESNVIVFVIVLKNNSIIHFELKIENIKRN